jgi:hypothetical protein
VENIGLLNRRINKFLKFTYKMFHMLYELVTFSGADADQVSVLASVGQTAKYHDRHLDAYK